MLFNSYEFLYFFLPTTLVVFFALSGFNHVKAAAAWLALVSIFFYGYWSPRYVILLLASIAINFAAGHAIARFQNAAQPKAAQRILVLALIANLGALGYFKYANFFIDSINSVAHADLHLAKIILPIGISFFTFTQIAFLVDTFRGKVHESRFIPYTLFVTFFPHLIAGPVLHHAEMMPQFAQKDTYRFNLKNFLIGVAFFSIGLFKKVILADGIQPFVGPVFEADPTYPLSAIEAWGGALAYTMQLYFDFSGYSDMAIGLAKMVNIDLPLNFNSPYKAKNISEFWRRWHMTLSRFLRDYLYISLGGNRKGPVRRYANLLTTMLLGGLWHGAGWTFVIWGGLHGLYLVIHQLWQAARERVLGHDLSHTSNISRMLSLFITFLSVVVAWVFFRATSFETALRVLMGMAGVNGIGLIGDWSQFDHLQAFGGIRQLGWIALLLGLSWLCPNSQTLVDRMATSRTNDYVKHERWAWLALGGAAVFIFLLAAINGSRGASEFIYFNF